MLGHPRVPGERSPDARLHHIRRCIRFAALSAGMTCAFLLLACNREPKQKPAVVSGGGEPARGKLAIERYGCAACHSIPGITGPKGMVGPPLDHIAQRASIAGRFPNNPETMSKWLQNPPRFDSQASMPDLGITPADSRDITAYLFTLK